MRREIVCCSIFEVEPHERDARSEQCVRERTRKRGFPDAARSYGEKAADGLARCLSAARTPNLRYRANRLVLSDDTRFELLLEREEPGALRVSPRGSGATAYRPRRLPRVEPGALAFSARRSPRSVTGRCPGPRRRSSIDVSVAQASSAAGEIDGADAAMSTCSGDSVPYAAA